MHLSDFDYHLPKNLIAQDPLLKRDSSKLLVLDKESGLVEHQNFVDIISYLKKDDVLVLNDTKVIPARLIGKKATGGVVEVLLIRDLGNDVWQCLVKPFKKIAIGTVLWFNFLKGECVFKDEKGIAHFRFFYENDFLEVLETLGEMPLPSYITKKLIDQSRYQTVYAKNVGSVAAPTAGLHFTDDLLKKITRKGVKIVYITLHVGIGTFRPVTVSDIAEHKMHDEFFFVSESTASVLNNCKGRIVGVGTTVVRTLESIYDDKFVCKSGFTDLFIYPGYQFRAIDMMITNFHLPKSTLLMMVSAFAKREYILKAYKEAVSHQYRFFSFGDAMLIK